MTETKVLRSRRFSTVRQRERLADADLPGHDDQRLAPVDGVGELLERGCVRRALEQDSAGLGARLNGASVSPENCS